jgi:hypothetical protein
MVSRFSVTSVLKVQIRDREAQVFLVGLDEP